MNKGGYQILDLKNTNFALGTGEVIAGAFDTIFGTKKPILVSGIKIAARKYNDTYVDFTAGKTGSIIAFTVVSSAFEGIIYGKKISIASTDTVTISENA